MFKKIPGNLDYRINLSGKIINCYDKEVFFEVDEKNNIIIEFFGKNKKLNLKWLSYLAWYECGYIKDLELHYNKINFLQVSEKLLKVYCGVLMSFKNPIYYKPGFRYIPNYPRYAINVENDVIDTFTNQIVTKRELSTDGYPVIYIYNPEKIANRYIRIHRLMGFAWLPNNDFINKPIINHKDGVRINNKLENLEWCSLEENSRHAFDTRLNSTPIKMKTRDVFTGEIVIYNSAADMSRSIGMSNINASSFNIKLPGYLYNKRYEIKLFDDDSPWYYENINYSPKDHGKSIYTITVINKDSGEIKDFSNVKPFYRAFKLRPKTGTIEEAVTIFKEKYVNYDIEYKRNAVSGPYKVMDLDTKETFIYESMWEAGKHIGRTRTEIQYDLSRNLKFIYSNRWIIVANNDNLKIEEYRNKPSPFNKVLIINTNNQTEIIATSIKDAARKSGFDPKCITKHLNTGNLVRGVEFRALEQ